jgi:YD repeat-containing protein
VGNLTSVVYPANHGITLSYDALNRLTSMVDGVGQTRYEYDSLGQLVLEDGPWTDDAVSFSYTNRQRSGLNLAQPQGQAAWTQSYGYDATWRLTSLT